MTHNIEIMKIVIPNSINVKPLFIVHLPAA